ncbi:GNAT family N-acetyltransferase [Jatrophihabitans sp. YIM 134969]
MRVTTVDGASTRELRRIVLRGGQDPGIALPGDDRPDAVHIAAFDDDGALLGACLVFAEPCDWRPEQPAWILRSMAVDPASQGRGVGRAVLAHAVGVARAAGAALLWCHARETAEGFWHREGWRDRYPDGDPRQVYVEAATGLEHRDLHLPLT